MVSKGTLRAPSDPLLTVCGVGDAEFFGHRRPHRESLTPSMRHVPLAVRTVGGYPTEASIMRPPLDAYEEEPRSRSRGQHHLPDPGLDVLDLAGENVDDGIHER